MPTPVARPEESRVNHQPVDGFAFPRQKRVLTRARYQQVFNNNWRLSDRYFTVLAGRQSVPRQRIGITVSKKVSKRAVVRNRIKRVVRESFRHIDTTLPIADYVVIARGACAAADNASLRGALDRHWQRIISGEHKGGGDRRRSRRTRS